MLVLLGKSLKKWGSSMHSSEVYRVTVWDKQAQNPYCVLNYEDIEDAQKVARSMKRHYIDDWGAHAESIYEVRLQRIQGDSNG
jgi:hypothetical protein